MILCCGEALIDMIPNDTADGQSGYVPHPGGAVFNTAIALGRLGVKTQFLSGLSNDLFGAMIAQALASSHVNASLSITSNLPTTLAFVSLNEGSASYTFYDENTAGRSLEPSQIPDFPTDISALYFGGISLCSEPCGGFYEAILTREAKTNVIMLDPNIRTGFIKDETQYRARLARIIALTDILKVSDEDLDWIIPGPESVDEKFKQIAGFGPLVTILTSGKYGVKCISKSGFTIDVPACVARVIDTVGAGDTFNAGVLFKLLELGVLSKNGVKEVTRDGLTTALEFGALVASITVTRAGANPPWLAELGSS